MQRKRIIVLLLIALLAACNTEKRRLSERLPSLEQQYKEASRRLSSRKSSIVASEDRVRSLKADLALHNTETQSYLQLHPIAAGCIKASRVNWGDGGDHSPAGSELAKVGGVLCNVALLNRTFGQEVADVTRHLAESSARARELKEQIAAEERTLAAQADEIKADEDAVDRASADIASLQQQLSMH